MNCRLLLGAEGGLGRVLQGVTDHDLRCRELLLELVAAHKLRALGLHFAEHLLQRDNLLGQLVFQDGDRAHRKHFDLVVRVSDLVLQLCRGVGHFLRKVLKIFVDLRLDLAEFQVHLHRQVEAVFDHPRNRAVEFLKRFRLLIAGDRHVCLRYENCLQLVTLQILRQFLAQFLGDRWRLNDRFDWLWLYGSCLSVFLDLVSERCHF